MLSLRQKSDYHFWFSFFHEAGHIVGGKKRAIFLDEARARDDGWADPEETLADDFAAKTLIPLEDYRAFLAKKVFTLVSVKTLAQNLGIAPGIIAGRLQHEGYIKWDSMNGLKRRLELVEACGLSNR
jgi:HTH-type transcriptional regulator/antitoxin HigA